MLSKVKQKFQKQSDFKKGVITLMSGTFLAQAIPILASPLLTRIYSPADFGIYSLVTSIVAFGAILATGRYEIAIMLPERPKEAYSLFLLSVILTVLFSVITFLLVIFFGDAFARLIELTEPKWLYLVPLLILVTAGYQSINYLVNREKKFKVMATNRVGRATVLGISQVLIGKVGLGNGLIWGTLISQCSSIIFLLRNIKFNIRVDKQDIKNAGARYIKFPKFSLLADGINSLSNQLPVVLMIAFFSVESSGLYGLTLRILGLPIALISSAALDVFKQRASEDFIRTGSCRAIYIKTLKGLCLIGIPGFTLLYFIAPALFSFIFGPEWRGAGEYARILSIMFLFRFISSPLSYVIYIAEKQQYDLIWQICLLAVTVGAFWLGKQIGTDIACIWIFSLGYSLLYFIYIILSYCLANGKTTTQ